VLVSEKKFCCCLIKWEKTNKQTKNPTPNQIKSNHPKFKCNTVSVSPSASSPTSVVVSSKEEKNKQTKRVWGQLCECLSAAAAHLSPTVRCLLLQALFMQISEMSFTLT
jgi:hypothetical protein